jgi:hypothetical protein
MVYIGPIAFVSVEFVVGALRVGIISLGLGFLASFVLLPFLVGHRLRSLFTTVGPTNHWVSDYLILMTLIGGGEISVFALTVDLIGIEYADPMVLEQLILYASVALCLVYVTTLCLIPLVVLPRLGIDWDKNDYDVRTIGLVITAVLWYHIGMVLLSPYVFDLLAPVYRVI